MSRTQHNNPKSSEALGLTYHYEMVSDIKRVYPFKHAINETCSGKRVLESGAGSAIMSILAAKAGATKVYAVEIDSEVAAFARENIEKSGYADIITLIEGDVKKVTIDDLDGEKVDVVIAENMSTWQVTEPQIQIMNYINDNLIEDDGIRLPELIMNKAELANAQFRFEDVIDLRTHFFEFTGIPRSNVLSNESVFEQLDLYDKNNQTSFEKEIKFNVRYSGTINCVRLTSPIVVHGNIYFNSSDSLMPPVVFPLDRDLEVKEGDVVKVKFTFNKNTDWNNFKCEIV